MQPQIASGRDEPDDWNRSASVDAPAASARLNTSGGSLTKIDQTRSGTDAVSDEVYAARLIRLQTARWKRWLNVQAVYGWNLRRLAPGFTLDLGCGIGRTLQHLRGHGVGIDINEHCVRAARGADFSPSPLTSFDSWPSTIAPAGSTRYCSPTSPST